MADLRPLVGVHDQRGAAPQQGEPPPSKRSCADTHFPPPSRNRSFALQQKLRSLDNGAMPTVLALGNRLVFHEVGWALANFLQWIEGQKQRIKRHRTTIESVRSSRFAATDFFRPSSPESAARRRRRILRSMVDEERRKSKKAPTRAPRNVLIGAYETDRPASNSFFEVALDFDPGALVEELRVDHAHLGATPMGVRHSGHTSRTPGAGRALLGWMARRVRRLSRSLHPHVRRTQALRRPPQLPSRLGGDVPRQPDDRGCTGTRRHRHADAQQALCRVSTGRAA